MFVTILMSVFITVGIRQKSGLKSGQRVAEVYEEDVDRIAEVYNEVASKSTGNEELEKLKEELAQANATEDKILKDYKAYANGKLLTGTMPNREATTDAVSVAASGDYAYIRMPQGGYLTNASSGYPEIKASITDINNATGYKYTQSQYDENYNNGYNAGSNGKVGLIELGTGTSFDVKTVYSDYASLTASNFICQVVSVSTNGSQTSNDANNSSYSGGFNLTPTINYNASTGVATVGGTSGSRSYKTYGNDGTIITTKVTVKVYLKY